MKRYIFLTVITVSLETMKIVNALLVADIRKERGIDPAARALGVLFWVLGDSPTRRLWLQFGCARAQIIKNCFCISEKLAGERWLPLHVGSNQR